MSQLKIFSLYMYEIQRFIFLVSVVLPSALLLFSSLNSYMPFNLKQAMAQTNTLISFEFATQFNFLSMLEDSILPMKVDYELTGGVTGMNRSVIVNTDSLPPNEAHQLKMLVSNSNFFDIPSKLPSPPGARDLLNHTITIEVGEEKSHTIQTNDITMPPELRPLVEYLTEKAQKN
jgi:hypothetical protein